MKRIINYYKPDIIINSAAITDVEYCEKNKSNAQNVNVFGLKSLIKYSNKYTKIIQVSTDYVFDGKDASYNENSLPAPLNYYGRTKLEAENLLIGSQKSFIIIRPNTLYSVDKNNFFTWVFKSLSNNRKINVVNDQISNPSFVQSLILSIIDMILMKATGIYHHGSKDVLSRYDFSIKIAEKFNLTKSLISEIQTKELKQIAKRPLNSIMEISKIEKDFNLRMNFVDECIDDIYTQMNYA